MTPDKIISFVIEYFSDYFLTLIKTLQRPMLLIKPVWKESSIYSKEGAGDYLPAPKLFGFSAISIILGLIIQSNIPNHLASENYFQVVVTVTIFWIIFSSLVYLFLFPKKLKGNFTESLSLIMQIVSVQYVIANLTALIWGVIYQGLVLIGMPSNRTSFFGMLGENPFYIYFFAQFIFLVIYIPYALASAYHFTRSGIIRVLISTIFLTLCWSFFSFSFFDVTSSSQTGSGGTVSILATPTRQPGIALTTTAIPTPTLEPTDPPALPLPPINAPVTGCIEILNDSWHLAGSGPLEEYDGDIGFQLQGRTYIQVTFDLHGFTILSGDASAIFFDQPPLGAAHYVSLADYAENGKDGTQTVNIPLSAFPGLNLNDAVGTLHTRFWSEANQNYIVDVSSIKACA